MSSTTLIEINVIDTDDKDPAFFNSFYTGLMKRNSLPVSFFFSSIINSFIKGIFIQKKFSSFFSNIPLDSNNKQIIFFSK